MVLRGTLAGSAPQREHIVGFGGDAANITVFGAFAGSASIALILSLILAFTLSCLAMASP